MSRLASGGLLAVMTLVAHGCGQADAPNGETSAVASGGTVAYLLMRRCKEHPRRSLSRARLTTLLAR